MALTKREKYWHYDFEYKKKRFQGSTAQTNKNKAKLYEAKVRADAAMEERGLAPPRTAPMLSDFLENRFLDHVRQHNSSKPRTVAFYEEKTARLLEYNEFKNARLDEADEDRISKYTAWRASQPKRRNGEGTISNASINRELATLRKALALALEWRLISRRVKVRCLPGEKGREFVLTGELENAYLAAAQYPLKQAAVLMLDLGLRPEECVALRFEDCSEEAVYIRDGKSKNAKGSINQTARTLQVCKFLRELWPDSVWLFPGHKKGSHLQRSSLDHLHNDLRAEHQFPQDFVLYSCRHTFGTRLAESGAGPFEIKEAMRHSDIRVSQKYVHPSAAHLSTALKRKEALDKLIRGEVHEEETSKASG